MSYPKPWILGSTIINDGMDWHAAEWGSLLRGWQGLPRAQAILSERYGAWPLVAGVRRQGRRISLETHFLQLLEADRKLARKVYLQAIDYEDETPVRLLCTDVIPPNCATAECLLALGPWNVQTDGEGTWTIRDLVDPDNEIPVEGAVHFVAASVDGLRAILIEQAETNTILNPIFGLNVTDGWTNDAGNPFDTFERSTDQHKFGQASLHCVSSATADNAYSDTVADADGTETWTGSAWVYLVAGDFRLIVEENNGGWSEADTVDADDTLLNQWQRVSVTVTLTAGVTDARIKIKPPTTAASEFYVDGVDLVEADYVSSHVDGNLGPGYEWDTPTPHDDTSTRAETVFDLDDYADDLSDQPELTFRIVLSASYDYDDADWPQASDNPVFDLRGADNNNRIYCYFHNTTNAFVVYINGADRLQPSAVAFEAGDRIELVITLDFSSDVYKLYLDGTLVDTDTTALTAPTALAAWKLGAYYTEIWQSGWAIEQYQVFSKEFTQAEVTLMNGEQLNARWIEVLCDQTDPVAAAGKETMLGFVASLAVHDDVRLRSRDGDIASTVLADDSVTLYVDVDTEDLVRPLFYIEPEAAKTSGFLYRCWLPIVWPYDESALHFPIGIIAWDTATLIAASKMQADGDDLRVYVDGLEVDRWVEGIDTATTNVWIELDWVAQVETTLYEDLLIGDDPSELTGTSSLAAFPSVGVLMIGSEAFLYDGIDYVNRRFLNVSRAARGTAAAGHTAGDTISWVQHDIWVYYGDATLAAPTAADDDYKPMIELDSSTNSSWVFDYFGKNSAPSRYGTWTFAVLSSGVYCSPSLLTGQYGGYTDPWDYLLIGGSRGCSAHVYFRHPGGFSNINVNGAEDYWYSSGPLGITGPGDLLLRSKSDDGSWTTEYTVPAGADGVWKSWTYNAALTAGAMYVGYYFYSGSDESRLGNLDTLTLTITDAPTVTLGAEQLNYDLDMTITNETTGDAIQLQTQLVVGQVLLVDTDGKRILNLSDPESLYGALTQIGGIRKEWLKLVDGVNELTIEEANAAHVNIQLIYDRRYYE